MTIEEGDRILVTGATGKSLLYYSSKGYRQHWIRAACYTKSNKINNVKGLHGLDCIYEIDADMLNADLDRAFHGVDYAFLIPSSSQKRVEHIRNYVEAAKRNNVKFLVLLSIIRPEEHTTTFGEEFRQMEEIVENASTNIAYCFIRTSILMQTLFLFAPDIRKGVLPLPIKDGRFAALDNDDAASFAAAVMLDPNRHSSKAYHLTGPEILGGPDIAMTASRALGIPVRFLNVSQENCKKLMLDSGLEEWLADGFNGLWYETAKNRFAFETSNLLKNVLGRQPRSWYDFFLDHKARFTEEEGEDTLVPPPAVEELKIHKKKDIERVSGGGTNLQQSIDLLKRVRLEVSDAINYLEECR